MAHGSSPVHGSLQADCRFISEKCIVLCCFILSSPPTRAVDRHYLTLYAHIVVEVVVKYIIFHSIWQSYLIILFSLSVSGIGQFLIHVVSTIFILRYDCDRQIAIIACQSTLPGPGRGACYRIRALP